MLDYIKLAICTGSRARTIPLTGVEVHYLRSIDDVLAIKANVGDGKKVVISGGGYIWLESAAVLRKLGMDVTILEMLPRILARVTTPELSNFYTRIHKEQGVNVYCNVMVTAAIIMPLLAVIIGTRLIVFTKTSIAKKLDRLRQI